VADTWDGRGLMTKLLKVPIVLTLSEEGLDHLKEWVEEDGFDSLDEMISYLTMDSLIQDLEEKMREVSPKAADDFRAEIEAAKNRSFQ
jgi:hypothetical protein